MPTALTTRDILKQMAASGEDGVYVLGSFERRITLYTQQVRALNLIHALFSELKLKKGSTLAVIGGGAAGLTAAAGAAIRGARVSVFEEMGDLLPMFRNNRHRLLHPHLYDWPEEGSEDEHASLPVLDWKADLAGNVAARLLEQWETLERRYSIQVHRGVQRLQPIPGAGAPRQLTWNTEHSGFDDGEFDAVILAVGFGLERRVEEASFRAYWADDDLDRVLNAPNNPKRYLISGTGDGGLMDLLRVRLRDFRHERIVRKYLQDASLGEVKKELLRLEESFHKGQLQERDFFKHYKGLPVPQKLDEQLRKDLREDTTAVLNGRNEFPLGARASILNRFLASRLIRLGVRYESGEFSVKRVKEAYEVTFLDANKQKKHAEEFDDLIIRHGPEPALERGFKSIWEKAGARLRELAELDQTRRPLFNPEDFASSPSGVGVSTPSATAPTSAPAAAPTREDCFGREELKRQLVAAVLAEEPRPTMVLGPPGIGKSNLTIEAYYDPGVARRYASRRYFVRLDGATSLDLMVSAVAAALGVRSETNLWEAVKRYLQGTATLLVLDNIETPWEADRAGTEALLAELGSISGLSLVCSVRGGEHPHVPRRGPSIKVTRLDDEAARDLFCAIAEVDRKDPLLGRLLGEQDGLPLAIKLLALTAQGSTLENTWQLWQRERAALYEQPGKSDKQSSLAASLEVSIKSPRMTEGARRLLSMLAQLPGGVAQKDLEQLLPGLGHGAAQVLSKVGLASFEQERLRMLAPIREHVQRSRPPSPEDRERMSTYYLELPGSYGGKVGNEGGADAVRLLMTEFANIESFIEEALGGRTAAAAIDAAIALSDFMRFSGHGTPQVLQQARSAARNSGDAKRESKCLKCLGDLTLARSQHDEARRRYEEALPLYVQVGDVLGRANCIQGLGDIALARSQPEQARQLFERSLSLYMSISDPYSIGMTHRRLARLASDATERRRHVLAARQAWESINRPDLLQLLRDKFGDAQ